MLGARLRDLRRNCGKSAIQIAGECNVTPDSIYRWERGERKASLDNVLILMKRFGVDPSKEFNELVNKVPNNKHRPSRSPSCPAQTELTIDLACRGSVLQKMIRERDSIRAFETFLHHASVGNWEQAHMLMASGWRQYIRAPNDLRQLYRMTYRHEFHYYIPTKIYDDHEEFDIDFSFWDFFPELQYRDVCVRVPLADLVQEDIIERLGRDLLRALPNCYKVPRGREEGLEGRVFDFVGRLTIRDLVIRDDLIEKIGRELKFEPIKASDTAQGKVPAMERRRLFHVVMVREEGRWLVERYNSILMEKR